MWKNRQLSQYYLLNTLVFTTDLKLYLYYIINLQIYIVSFCPLIFTICLIYVSMPELISWYFNYCNILSGRENPTSFLTFKFCLVIFKIFFLPSDHHLGS
jgi:hypothetical protein